jgi:hypothetical protein
MCIVEQNVNSGRQGARGGVYAAIRKPVAIAGARGAELAIATLRESLDSSAK